MGFSIFVAIVQFLDAAVLSLGLNECVLAATQHRFRHNADHWTAGGNVNRQTIRYRPDFCYLFRCQTYMFLLSVEQLINFNLVLLK